MPAARDLVRVYFVETDEQFLGTCGKHFCNLDDITVVGQSHSAVHVVRDISLFRPTVIVANSTLVSSFEHDIIRALRAHGGSGQLLLRGLTQDDHGLLELLNAGVCGILSRSNTSAHDLEHAIRLVTRGGIYLQADAIGRLLRALSQRLPVESEKIPDTISVREREILLMLGKGYPAREIADLLSISYQTVRTHQRNIYKKLGVHSITQALSVFDNVR